VAKLSVPGTADPAEGRRFLRGLDHRLERLDRAILIADWDLYTGRSRSHPERWQLERSALLSDERLLRWVRSVRADRWPAVDRRRLELLGRIVVDAQVEQHPEIVRQRSELLRRIVAFRPLWKGRRVNRAVLQRVLREDVDEANRRRAYYALDPLQRPLEAPLRELVRARNDRARDLGYPNFAEMRLGFQGLTVARLSSLCDDAVATAPARMKALRERWDQEGERSGWHPWDFVHARERLASLPDRSFPVRAMLPRILRALRDWGFRTERMRFKVVFHDLPSGGQTLAPDPPSDVRIQVHPMGGWHAYRVMFHEVGHAVHSASIRAPRHLLRWHENVPGFGGFHEGIAQLFEEIPRDEVWLSAQPGVDPGLAHAFAEIWREADLWDVAHLVSWLRVEQALYRDPDRDPSEEARRFDRRVFGYDDYVPASFVSSFWIDAPVYAPNYLFATLYHYQLARSLRERFGEPLWPNAKVGPALTREWFAPGSMYDWVPRLRELTGRPFSARDFRAAYPDQSS
jgi:peptidyl-dipeptidase A